MYIRSALSSIENNDAAKYLDEYYHWNNSGAYFEILDADNNLPNKITASDLYAVSMLQTPIPRTAGVGILVHEADEISALLNDIPNDIELGHLNQEEFNNYLGPGSPGLELWNLLRRNRAGDERWDVGPTRASKIMARKRPHLIPITDSVIQKVIGQRSKDDDWELWWNALSIDEELEVRAEYLRKAVRHPELSTLRILDVVLWHHGKYGQPDK